MDEVFKQCLIEESFQDFKNRGYTIRHWKTPMKVKYEFYEELKRNRIFEMGEFKEKILIFHGKEDDTALYKDSEEFSNKNLNVKLLLIEKESHRMSMENVKKVNMYIVKYMIEN